MSLTSDRTDPRLTRGVDTEPTKQAEVYLVDKGEGEFVRPVRDTYVHTTCGVATTMARRIAETYARTPKFYGATYCMGCMMHLPVGEFRWDDGEVVGS